MAKCLLDPTALVDLLRGRHEVVEMITSLLREGHHLGVCCVNVAELYSGLNPQELTRGDRLIGSLEYFDLSTEAAKQAGQFRYTFARQGISVNTPDALLQPSLLKRTRA